MLKRRIYGRNLYHLKYHEEIILYNTASPYKAQRNIAYIFDNDKSKDGRTLLGLPIKHFQDFSDPLKLRITQDG